jgi:glycosyltransferase involved in cell wall biosynthesis
MPSGRIAQLIESDGPGGAERVVAQLAMALQHGGAESVVFVPAEGEGWIADELAGSGVRVEPFRLDRPLSPRFAQALASTLRRLQIDLVHSHEFSMAVYGAWAARYAGLPHVITMHGGRYYADRLRRRVALRAAISLSRHTVAVSNSLAGQLCRDLWLRRSSVTTVPNGVVPAPMGQPTLRSELGLRNGQPLIVSVGNLYPVKGHRHLIDALAVLAPHHPDLHLAIVGRGPLQDDLRRQAQEHGLAERVHLLGLRGDIPALLASADMFVLPSLSEGLPLALLEAMFAMRPIVATRVGEVGVALADGEAGVLVPPGDARSLAGAIDNLVTHPGHARALACRARQRALAEYDLAQMVDRYVAAYQSAGAAC